MIVAIIDIGTNTTLLLVARLDDRGKMTTLAYEQRVPRLGQGVDAQQRIHPASIRKVIEVLKEYRQLLDGYRPDAIVVAGTSAVRDSQNKHQFSEMVRKETGFVLEILCGEDEAHWTYRGAISGLPVPHGATVVDIGGGSTEITVGTKDQITLKASMNIGSVRLTERFFKHDPPHQEEIGRAAQCVAQELDSCQIKNLQPPLIGVAGTATALAILDQKLPVFDKHAVTNYQLTRSNVAELFAKLKSTPSHEILQLSTVMHGRHDIITAGALILESILGRFHIGSLVVSERGLRYGLALREWERHQNSIGLGGTVIRHLTDN